MPKSVSIPTSQELSCVTHRSVELFHENEEKLAIEFNKVRTFSPVLALTLEHVHGGSIAWLGLMRGTGNVKKVQN